MDQETVTQEGLSTAQELVDDLCQWFDARPSWQRDAVRRILVKGDLEEADMKELVELCLMEAQVPADYTEGLTAIPFSKEALNLSDRSDDLRLVAVSDIHGINRLGPRSPLEFNGAAMTIVFGPNGAGKSGYTRILKRASGKAERAKLLSDVFQQAPAEQKCTLTYALNSGDPASVHWSPTAGPLAELRGLSLYDSDLGNVYVTAENEVALEPPLVALLRRLVDVSTEVGKRIKDEAAAFTKMKPRLPQEFVGTSFAPKYEAINHATTDEELAVFIKWDEKDEEALTSATTRMNTVGPADEARRLGRQVQYRQQLLTTLRDRANKISNAVATTLAEARTDAALKRKLADEDAKKVFSNAPLEGVGSESWRLLWTHARAYSDGTAYKEVKFPNVGLDARCVLCQQPLEDEAKGRLSEFEEFVLGRLERDARAAEERQQALLSGLPAILDQATLAQQIELSGITVSDEVARIEAYWAALNARHSAMANGVTLDALPVLPSDEVLTNLSAQVDAIKQAVAKFQADALNDNREVLKAEVLELRARKWCSSEQERLKLEHGRLKVVWAMENAARTCDTGAISSKSTYLYDRLVTAEYIARFKNELEALGGSRIQVELTKTRTAKGVGYYRVALRNAINTNGASTAEVLSEGEQRIVSIAAFLADTMANGGSTPFIFDDPISSLDAGYEERVAARLALLSKSRQVIVFTHRLSLIHELEEKCAEQESEDVFVQALSNERWGAGEPQGVPLYAQKPKDALNSLANARLQAARKSLEEAGSAAYEIVGSKLCSDVRVTVERLIEHDLLNDIVQRFRRDVKTKNKLHPIRAVEEADCRFLDAVMTKYSRYMHSQPDEAPVEVLPPDEIAKDLQELLAWQKAFTTRKKTFEQQ